MVAAIVLAGIWGIWKALVQRRYTETAGALGVSVVFVLIALFFVYQPERTIGAGQPVDQHALARVPVRRQPRHGRRPAAGQAPGRRPAVRTRRLPAVGGARVRRAAPLRRHRPPGRRRLPAAGRPARPRRATSAATTCARARRARRLRPALPAPRRRARTSATPSTRRCAKASTPSDRPASSRGYQVDKADAPGGRHPAGRRRLPAADARGRVLRRRARRRRAARVPVAGGDPRPGRRAGAARLRAGRAGHRDLPAAAGTTSSAAGWPSSPPRSSSRRCTRW